MAKITPKLNKEGKPINEPSILKKEDIEEWSGIMFDELKAFYKKVSEKQLRAKICILTETLKTEMLKAV